MHYPSDQFDRRAIAECELELVDGAVHEWNLRLDCHAAQADFADEHRDVKGDGVAVELAEDLDTR
jgi:hypothetical protein